MGSLRSRKGISEIIATLLIIMMTVTAGTLFAAYASGIMGNILNPVTSQPYAEQLSVEYYSWFLCNGSTSTWCPIVDVRNTGSATINLAKLASGSPAADYYLNGVSITAPTITCTSPATSTALVPGGACQLALSGLQMSSYPPGVAFVLKIVITTDGTTLTFSLIAGSNTH